MMIFEQIRKEVQRVGARMRSLRFGQLLLLSWLAITAIGVALLVWQQAWQVNGYTAATAICMLAAGLGTISFLVSRSLARDHRLVARRIEEKFPELDSRLLTSIDSVPAKSKAKPTFLQHLVATETVEHRLTHSWTHAVPTGKFNATWITQWFALASVAVVASSLFLRPDPPELAAGSNTDIQPVGLTPEFAVTIEPGNISIERGTSLLVLARFAGAMPSDATLIYTAADSQDADSGSRSPLSDPPSILDGDSAALNSNRIAMSRALDDPLFAGRIGNVRQPLNYYIEFASDRSAAFRVDVFEFPTLVRMDANLKYPEYTQLENKTIKDTRQISAVEGTQIGWIATFNKPVVEAFLEPIDNPENGITSNVSLTPVDSTASVFQVNMVPAVSQRFKLHLKDTDGRENKEPPTIKVTVIPNRPPDLKWVWPGRDSQISPLEEMVIQAQAKDDYGLVRYGVSYTFAGKESQDIELGGQVPAKQPVAMEHLFDMEAFDAEPDQLLTYYIWADDYSGPDEIRRTYSDMFFGEVRPFEEILRQGQQPPGGQQQQQQAQSEGAQQAEQQADLQKQIINATWKLIRRETKSDVSANFSEDVKAILDAQLEALEKSKSLAETVQDPQSIVHLENGQDNMARAADSLDMAIADNDAAPLKSALTSEQAAYEAFLKLRSREIEVIQSSQQQSSSSSSSSSNSRRQQQLDQLEMKDQEKPYEAQSTAPTTAEEEQAREVRQIQNRLAELARRQEDLNDQVKQLEAELQAAETAEEQAEIERRLQRLREQEEEILRDTDEVQSSLQQAQAASPSQQQSQQTTSSEQTQAQQQREQERQEALSEASEQLEETRENVRRASQALEEGRTSQALAAGERATREFQEMRDELRKQTAGEFDDRMRQMQQQADALEQRQQEIGQRLSESQRNSATDSDASDDQASAGDQPRQRPSLRDEPESDEIPLEVELNEQRQQLSQLLDNMQRTIEESETSEPLLARQLYDSLRDAKQEQIQEALQATGRAVELGINDQAVPIEQQARKGIEKLQEGIREAAEGILGDPTEALRRADSQLAELSQKLQSEIANADPTLDQAASENQSDSPGERNGQNQEGQSETGQSSGQTGERTSSPAEKQADQTGDSPGEQPSDSAGEQTGEPSEQPPGDQPGGQPGQESGQQPGSQPGQQPSGQQSGEQPGGQGPRAQQAGGQPGNQANGQQPGEQSDSPESSNQSQPGGQPGQPGQSSQPAQQPQRGGLRGGQSGGGGSESGRGNIANSLLDRTNRGEDNPLTGEGFREWSDTLRDVEEMLDDPDLRSQVSQIRDRAREIRSDFKRHSEEPQWDIVRDTVSQPLEDLRQRIKEELIRRASKEAVVPIDRDPVPPEFADAVRTYYERMGSGK